MVVGFGVMYAIIVSKFMVQTIVKIMGGGNYIWVSDQAQFIIFLV